MATTESLNSASSGAGVYVFSVAHERDVRPRTRAQGTHDVTTPTTPTNTQQGLALCHRVTLDSVAQRWVPARTAHGTPVPEQERPWVAHNQFHETTSDKRPPDNDKPLSQTCDTTTRC